MTFEEAARRYLSPPDCERFIKNINKQIRSYRNSGSPCDTYRFIDQAFTWSFTNEGHEYWNRLHQRQKQTFGRIS